MNKLVAIIGVLLIVWLIAGYEQPQEDTWYVTTTYGEFLWAEPAPTYTWNPQPDITAYEIAILLPYILGGTGIESIEGALKRHFIEEK